MPKLPTYDDACEQLGGRPWLEKPDTDRWFLADARFATPSGGVAALAETGSFDLKKRMSLSTKLIIFFVAVLGAIATVAANL